MALLDAFDTEQGRFGLGLLAMAQPSRMSDGERMLGALQMLDQFKAQRSAAEERKADREERARMRMLQEQQIQMQIEAARRQQAQAEAAARNQQDFISQLPNPQEQAMRRIASDEPMLGGGSPASSVPSWNQAFLRAGGQTVDPQAQLMYEAVRTGQISPVDYMKSLARPKPEIAKINPGEYTPESLQLYVASGDPSTLRPRSKPQVVNDTVVNLDQVPVGTVIPKPSNPTQLADLVAERDKFPAGDPRRKYWDDMIAKTTTHQPAATQIVNTGKPLLTEMATGLGKQLDSSRSNALAGLDTISGAQKIQTLLDSGQVVAGPLADARIVARQIGQVLGVGGKSNDETLANTRSAIQQLAQFELDAAQGMKGQGTLTESERVILRKAAGGEITFTVPELSKLSRTLEERARKRIRAHNMDVERLKTFPEAAPLIPFYQIEEPQAPSASQQRRATKRFNPTTRRIEDITE